MRRSSPNNFQHIFEFKDLTSGITNHLKQVYGTLSIGCLCAAATCMWTPAALVNNFGFLLLSIIGTIGLIFTMFAKRGNQDHGTKFLCFLGVASITGAGLRPLLERAAEIDPAIIVNALVYTGIIFGSFTFASLKTKRRSMLFIGGFCGSVMLGLSTTLLFSWIFGLHLISHLAYSVITLVVFSLYVIYDTQLIVEKASRGDLDYNLHALELFIDVVEIFTRLVIILMELSDKKKKDK
ncbi:unnamed protein product [Moneuplotes crassus]|uniref:Bax inhibitor 1 n=2 Tax=Euplotes crassus TaxID=5936 RepID=A0AAD1XUA4_EUPCR|nr:unnamed protein product [Moneuplotes crassus]